VRWRWWRRGAGGDEPERGGDGRLADAALAGDDDEPAVQERAHPSAGRSVNASP